MIWSHILKNEPIPPTSDVKKAIRWKLYSDKIKL